MQNQTCLLKVLAIHANCRVKLYQIKKIVDKSLVAFA